MDKRIEKLEKKLLSILKEEDKKSKLDFKLKIDFFLSSLATAPTLHSMKEVETWFRERRKCSKMKTKIIPIKQLNGWIQEAKTGNIRQVRRKFFSVIGIHTTTESREVKSWYQPIINQPEIGILGFLVKKINNVYHFLIQAKEEPGNLGAVQISPTLMATESNLLGVHGGKKVLYADYFTGKRKVKVIARKKQSEEGARFYKKSNLNIVVEISKGQLNKVHENFKWVTFYQIKRLMQKANVVNAPARSVISCLP